MCFFISRCSFCSKETLELKSYRKETAGCTVTKACCDECYKLYHPKLINEGWELLKPKS